MSELHTKAILAVVDEQGFLPDGSRLMNNGQPVSRADMHQFILGNDWSNDDSIYDYLAMMED